MCDLNAILACFSLSGLYVDANIAWQDRGEPRFIQQSETTYSKHGAMIVNNWVDVDESPQNVYAVVRFGYDIEPTRWLKVTLSEVSHVSSISTARDRGYNYVGAGVTVRPFR